MACVSTNMAELMELPFVVWTWVGPLGIMCGRWHRPDPPGEGQFFGHFPPTVKYREYVACCRYFHSNVFSRWQQLRGLSLSVTHQLAECCGRYFDRYRDKKDIAEEVLSMRLDRYNL